MLSKNNRKEQFRKQEPKKQRFAIKKLTVGVASVLIGFTFMGMNASADTTAETNSDAGSQPVAETQNSASNQADSRATLTTPNSQGTQSSDNRTVSDVIDQATKAAAAKSSDASATTPASSSAASASSADDQQNVKANAGSANEQKLASLYGTSFVQTQPVAATQETQKTLRGTQTQDVSDWQGFVNAMNDSSVGTINLTGDITVANKGTNVNGIKRPNPVINGGKMNLTGSNISGGLIIDGQNHAINFGANYLSFDTNNQKDSNPWDIDFKNLTINADGYDNGWSTYGGAFSPIYMGGDDITPSLLAKTRLPLKM